MLRGACLCGGVRYEIEGPVGPALYCHCSMCRKAHGSAFRARLAVAKSSLRFTQGEDLLTRYISSGNTVRTFCRRCGSAMVNFWTVEPDNYGLAMGTLDDDPGVRPACHVYVGSKAPWYEIADGLPQFEEDLSPLAGDSLAAIRNWRPVDDSLATSGQPTVAQLGTIAAAGFTAVINLGLHDDSRYALPDEAGTVRGLGMAYEHIPVQFGAPTEGDLLAFFEAMDAHRGGRCWVHCAANMRVSVFLGLYRVLRQGWPREKAFEVMNSLWEPNEVWAAFIERMLAAPPRG
jgi:protein tyrosine phosphatase (PTP) superfamily phosphohydrolase (DUF442 family)